MTKKWYELSWKRTRNEYDPVKVREIESNPPIIYHVPENWKKGGETK